MSSSGDSSHLLTVPADGTFFFPDVTAGTYQLQIESPGFERWTQTITLTDASPSFDAVLQIAGITESVVVAAPKLEEELPQEIERTGVRVQTVTGAQIENGGFYDVAQALQALVPGLFVNPKAG